MEDKTARPIPVGPGQRHPNAARQSFGAPESFGILRIALGPKPLGKGEYSSKLSTSKRDHHQRRTRLRDRLPLREKPSAALCRRFGRTGCPLQPRLHLRLHDPQAPNRNLVLVEIGSGLFNRPLARRDFDHEPAGPTSGRGSGTKTLRQSDPPPAIHPGDQCVTDFHPI